VALKNHYLTFFVWNSADRSALQFELILVVNGVKISSISLTYSEK